MKYCSHCGAQIDDNAVICVKCGCSVAQNNTNPQDAPNAGFAVLSFFFPVVGLILWLVWMNTSPLKAKSCGKGALIGFISGVVLWLIYAVIIGTLLGSIIGGAAPILIS
jgi:hypothetical protein